MHTFIWMLLCIILGHVIGDNNDIIKTLAQQVRSLKDELRQVKLDFSRRLYSDMETVDLILRDDLKNDIIPSLVESQVRDFMANLLKDKSLDSMIRSQVTTEIKDLKMRLNVTMVKVQEIKGYNSELQAKYSKLQDENSFLRRNLRLKFKSNERSMKNTSLSDHYHVRKEKRAWETRVQGTFSAKTDQLQLQINNLVDALNDTVEDVDELRRQNSEREGNYKKLRDENAMLRRHFERKFKVNERSIRNISSNVDHLVGNAMRTVQGRGRKSFSKKSGHRRRKSDKKRNSLKDMVDSLKEGNYELNAKFNKLSDKYTIFERDVRLKFLVNDRSMEYTANKVNRIEREVRDGMRRVVELESWFFRPFKLLDPTNQMDTTTVRSITSEVPHHVSVNKDTVDKPGYDYSLKQNMSRLLIAPHKSESRQFSFHDGQLAPFPHLNRSGITALAFDLFRGTIIFSTHLPQGIYSLTLDGAHLVTLSTRIYAIGMAVDGRQLFLVTVPSHKALCRIYTDSKILKILNNLRRHGRLTDVTLDTRKKIIYISTIDAILAANYDGRKLKNLITGTYIHGVTLDLKSNLLYFNIDYMIMRYNVTERRSSMISRLRETARDLTYYSNTVYVSSHFGGSIYAVDLNTNVPKRITSVAESSVICLLP